MSCIPVFITFHALALSMHQPLTTRVLHIQPTFPYTDYSCPVLSILQVLVTLSCRRFICAAGVKETAQPFTNYTVALAKGGIHKEPVTANDSWCPSRQDPSLLAQQHQMCQHCTTSCVKMKRTFAELVTHTCT
jgi:hypothetical protein